jgi:hypothetical protein
MRSMPQPGVVAPASRYARAEHPTQSAGPAARVRGTAECRWASATPTVHPGRSAGGSHHVYPTTTFGAERIRKQQPAPGYPTPRRPTGRGSCVARTPLPAAPDNRLLEEVGARAGDTWLQFRSVCEEITPALISASVQRFRRRIRPCGRLVVTLNRRDGLGDRSGQADGRPGTTTPAPGSLGHAAGRVPGP